MVVGAEEPDSGEVGLTSTDNPLDTWGSYPEGGDHDLREEDLEGGVVNEEGNVEFQGGEEETPGFWESLVSGGDPLTENSHLDDPIDDQLIEIVDFSEQGWSDEDLDEATPDSASDAAARSFDGLTFNTFDVSSQDPEAPDPGDWLPDNWKWWVGGIAALLALVALRPYASLGAEVAG